MKSPNSRGDNVPTRHFVPPSKPSSAGIGYILLKHWPKEPHGNLQTIQVMSKAVGRSLQSDGDYFFSFSLILCEFYIIHHCFTHLPVPSYFSSAPATSPPPREPRHHQIQNKTKLRKYLIVEAAVCHSISHNIHFCPHIPTCKCSLQ